MARPGPIVPEVNKDNLSILSDIMSKDAMLETMKENATEKMEQIMNTMDSFFKQMEDDYDYSINKTKKSKKKVVKKKKKALKEEDEKMKALKTAVLKESCNGETILRVLESNDSHFLLVSGCRS